MKELHLICNAHIDPVWLWNETDGLAAALATFRSAADLLDEFDFIFCHNESYLYESVKRLDPVLFERIKKAVAAGKWKIMGGWYIQPDCLMPSGETLTRNIREGMRFFEREFGAGALPETAVNLDSFGHSAGLVQIIKKSGCDNYLVCRPHFDFWPAPSDALIWKGFDGSTVKVLRDRFHYSSPMGEAVNKIKKAVDYNVAADNRDVWFCLWGVGNHGGGPSRTDLRNIKAFKNKTDINIIHSHPDGVFSLINPLLQYDKSLISCMPGCYTSMREVKSTFAKLENEIFMVEKLSSYADACGLIEYPEEQIDKAVKKLIFCSFHDILPGTCIEEAKDEAVNALRGGIDIINSIKRDIIIKAGTSGRKANEGEYPIIVLNPHPYPLETIIQCDLLLPNIDFDESNVYSAVVRGESGEKLKCQIVKESANINFNWQKRVAFKCVLDKPLNRFYATLITHKRTEGKQEAAPVFDVSFDVYKDDGEAWGHNREHTGMGWSPVTMKEGKARVTEHGNVLTVTERVYTYKNSRLVLLTTFYRDLPYADLDIRSYFNEEDAMLKMRIDAVGGEYIGQAPYGTDVLFDNGCECAAQRFTAVRNGASGKVLGIINNGVYGSCYKKSSVNISLLRTAGYAAHIVDGKETGTYRELFSSERLTPRMEIGESRFKFRIGKFKEKELERLATEFNQPPMAVSIFPSGAPEVFLPSVSISNPDIALITCKKSVDADGYILRVLNNYSEGQSAVVKAFGAEIKTEFGAYEVKTLLYAGGSLTELDKLFI